MTVRTGRPGRACGHECFGRWSGTVWKIRTRDSGGTDDTGETGGIRFARRADRTASARKTERSRWLSTARRIVRTTADRRSATVAASVRDDGRIAVRAHRTPVPQGCGDLPRHARPRIPKTTGMARAEAPGPRWPARAGDAGAQRWTDPDGNRVRGLGGVGENVGRRLRAGWTAHHGRRGRATRARAVKAWGHRCGIRRPGVPDARGRTPRAMFGSGHCLQSRISHDSFLVGYDWVNWVVGAAVTRNP